jgi:hypothetical protein
VTDWQQLPPRTELDAPPSRDEARRGVGPVDRKPMLCEHRSGAASFDQAGALPYVASTVSECPLPEIAEDGVHGVLEIAQVGAAAR